MKKIVKIIKDCTPPLAWRMISRIRRKNRQDMANEKLYFCPVCNKEVVAFIELSGYYNEMYEKYQFVHSIYCMETLNSKAYSCPYCGASDRDRLYAIYLNERFKRLKENVFFLDIAPARSITEFVKRYGFIRYRSVDLFMDNVDDKADITDMHIYSDESFDIILCSHVLEHVENDRKAMAELYRILKPSGFAIVMVPINLSLRENFENPEYKTEAERWKYFGQNDHVRIYSKSGFVNRLTQTGFNVSQLGIDYFGEEVFNISGLSKSSVLYVLEK
jgi:hypothetical protein